MVYTQKLTLRSEAASVQEITQSVEAVMIASGIRDGILTVETSVPASGVFLAPENSRKALQDIMKEMRRLVPARINFVNEESPEYAAGCVKSALFGASVSRVVKDGMLASEDGNGIYFADYDGPRDCCCLVCVVGE